MTKNSGRGKDIGLGPVASADELIFNLLEFGAFVLIATFLLLILMMGGIH